MQRRDFLQRVSLGAALSPLAAFEAAAQTVAAPARIRITAVKSTRLKLVKSNPVMEQPSVSPPLRYSINTGGITITEIRTDQGLVGIGPGVDAQSIAFANHLLAGADPFDMNDHAFRLYDAGHRGGGSVEIALWDLIGKATGQPLYKLWGGAVAGVPTEAGRHTVMPYASQWTMGTPENRAREVELVKAAGWRAIKLRIGSATVREDVALVEATRKAAGDDFIITCDANKAGPYASSWPHYPWDFQRAAATARALRPYDITWLEEPLPRFDYDQLAELRKLVEVPLAGGENNVGLDQFLMILQKGCFDFVQPEVLAVGPTMLRSIAALAAAYDVKVVPHAGSGNVSSVALLHLICSLPNAPMMEIIHEPPAGDAFASLAIFTEPPKFQDGFFSVPDGPGLGVTILPDLILPD